MLLATVLSAWLQYAADGALHARVRTDGPCPSLAGSAGTRPMVRRDGPVAGFPDTVCEAPVADGETGLHVDALALPEPPRAARRIVVFGDTGCRMKGDEQQQNCESEWFFPQIARAVAAEKPDLILHVGDYFYRENQCTTAMGAACVNAWGDNAKSWDADWFTPAAPMFAAAPLLLLRGNHEDCARGGPGWFHYLEVHALTTCVDTTGPYAVQLPGLRIVAFDTATFGDAKPDPAPALATDRVAFEAARALAAGAAAGDERWFVTHRPVYINATAAATLADALDPFDAVLAGHTHTFQTMNVAARPPLVINGEGGDALDAPSFIRSVPAIAQTLGFQPAGAPFDVAQYGYAVYERTGEGWRITLKDRDARPLALCLLAKRAVRCGAPNAPAT